jgi:hypothetical protein
MKCTVYFGGFFLQPMINVLIESDDNNKKLFRTLKITSDHTKRTEKRTLIFRKYSSRETFPLIERG